MLKNRKLVTPLLFAMLMSGSVMTHAAVINGRVYLPDTVLPAYLVGLAPGIEAYITTNSKWGDGIIYTGNTLTVNYTVLDADLDWVDDLTKQEIESNIYWYYLKPSGVSTDGKIKYVIDGALIGSGKDYFVKPEDKGRVIGATLFAKTATGTPDTSNLLEILDVRNIFTLVPKMDANKYDGQAAGTVFIENAVVNQNNISDVVIRACPVGEMCEGAMGIADKLDIVIYQNIAKPGEEYVFQEIDNSTQTPDKLRVKTWYGVKVFAMEEDPANPGQYLRTNIDVTEQYKDSIEWELFDAKSPANRQKVNATYNPLRKHMQFKTQKFNDTQSFILDDGIGGDGSTVQPSTAGNLQSTEHQSQQGIKFKITVND